MAKKHVPIKYTSRDFASIKRDLEDYAKRYYPESYRDFSEASFGSLMLDTVAYVGDILSFYLDYQVNESFLDSAIEYENIIRLSRQLGYKYPGKPTSYGIASLYVMVPANASGIGPDTNYLPVLQKGSILSSNDGKNFNLSENVDFSDPNNEVVTGRVNETTGTPTHFVVKTYGKVISGDIVEASITVGPHERFMKKNLVGTDIAEVISVFDSEGHEYFEVEHLSQNIVFREVANRGSNTDTVKNLLKPFVVPRRFVVERTAGLTTLQFGYGSEDQIKSNMIADPSEVVLKMHGKEHVSDSSFDPANILSTDKFGVVPSNTILNVIYRQNNAEDMNVAANALTKITNSKFIFKDVATLSDSQVQFVANSLQVSNDRPISGDISLPTSDEIRTRAMDHFATQNRIVTKQDYVSYVYSMPPKFGAVKRASVVRDSDSFKRNLNLYVMSEASDGSLTATNNEIKQNLKTWINRSKMVHDTIDILDGTIINLGINFKIIAQERRNKFDVLNNATKTLSEYLLLYPDFGESFKISNIYSVLNSADGVLDTTDVVVVNKVGGSYSDAFYDLKKNMSADGRLISFEDNLIWEIKFPFVDVKGAIQ